MEKKYVYSFEEGNREMKAILGGKGANLAEMSGLGIRVPPGFTVTTEVCDIYHQNNKNYPSEVKEQISHQLRELENKMGKKLGEANDPLLVSVRSGAAASMPGMMDTILNLGLNDQSVEGLAQKSNNPRFAWDSYRRFIQMFGEVVMEIKGSEFEEILEKVKDTVGVQSDTDLTAGHLEAIVKRYRAKIIELKGRDFPQDPMEQLQLSIDAVFNSWNNYRAIRYREINNIKGLVGTAVNIQAMVFGNLNENSGTGVCFTRNPSTGENKFYGEYLMNAQGEDVVAGIRTPQPISALAEQNKAIYDELVAICDQVEKHYQDMQDMEFTIQGGKLFILQARNGKRTAAATVKIAVDLVKEGVLTKAEALMKVQPEQLDQLLHKQLDLIAKAKAEVIATGLPASPGAAVGQVVFTAAEAYKKTQQGLDVVLVRVETSPEDIDGMHSAKGILTARGGMTSHAAVVARGLGTCCIAGCADIQIDEKGRKFTLKESGLVVKEGDFITLDGGDGQVYLGKLNTQEPELSGDFGTIMNWSDEIRELKIRTNADTPQDAKVARKFGAEGIGLCRTEHMFFEGDRIKAVREMILASDVEGRQKALAKLLPYQKQDFIGLFKTMEGYPVTIRLLDPPLHEFLPITEKDIYDLAREMEVDAGTLKAKISDLHEFNPMLGHRGCRLAITYPEIYDMQVRAIIEAAIEVAKECPTCGRSSQVAPEIMIPLVGNSKEFSILKQRTVEIAKAIIKSSGLDLPYKIGTMIEVPRAAVTADQIAEEAEFFSFGTNDLTQMGCGFSRDDAGKFLKEYVAKGIYDRDPFEVLDQEGVGELIRIAVEKGRKVRSDLKIGICGEHGGEPSSVEFCHGQGFDYVSCSPFRVPIARLAAAQAVIRERKQ
ncbi:MAG: pyruvate, phosphate dikinase [Candidatus Buchananbacteria bacterium RIFCSPLOWO2_01_FULL_39_33]|uniref:Pyruvate, phosphate dikinase n=1 Tax=Candidatus Buchananbacteria bacterium RIFCSPLOWO2_01_FULL_39_33 TaxID=1797543 RepID=A0A1G1YLA6_9BACT|nr:MAG: pyruvate, phosphate dikinase [Candidatus Buchananbacteria bacterium RIFCSPHIGHO2_01_FULL_40_35]OGY53122.1 MAG: pyruvate, phosphate dikinase [Candidatus Buchananbacteria bacterium RIFCSPLOWO2_01_FULL_39_33]